MRERFGFDGGISVGKDVAGKADAEDAGRSGCMDVCPLISGPIGVKGSSLILLSIFGPAFDPLIKYIRVVSIPFWFFDCAS